MWRSELFRSGCWFFLLFILFALPGFFLRDFCTADVRGLVRLFCPDEGLRRIEFEILNGHQLRVVIINQQLMNSDGSGLIRQLDVNPSGLVWQPTALLLTLVFAVPLPGWRQTVTLLVGVTSQQLCAGLLLHFRIWEESTEVNLVTLAPWAKTVAVHFAAVANSQLLLAVPVLVWFLCAFRREDWINSTRKQRATS